MVEFYYCGNCGCYFADAELTTLLEDQTGLNLFIPAYGHEITFKSEGFEATCTEDGMVEFYYCGNCGCYFADAELTTLLEDQTGANLTIPAYGHEITFSNAGFEATCTEDGMMEFYYCGNCGCYFADAELTTLLEDQTGANLLIPAYGHEITFKSEGFEATCTEDGMMEFYYCGNCGCYFADAELTTLLEDQTGLNLSIPAYGHEITFSNAGFEATCTEDGMMEFYYCGNCGCYFADAELTTLLEDQTGLNLFIPAYGHEITFQSEGFEATCTEDGMVEFYYCGNCGCYFADAELTTLLEDQTGLNLSIPAYGHEITFSNAGFEATCTEDGMMEFYYCGNCGCYFADAELTTLLEDQTGLNLSIPAYGHEITFQSEGFEATCTEDGMIEFYYCGNCGCYFADAELTTLLEDQTGANLTIPALGHAYESVVTAPTCTEAGYTTYTCSVCGDSYVADETAALDHSYDEGVVTAPGCTEKGYTTYTCTVCGHSYTGNQTAPTGHKYEAAVTAPTCTEPGYTTYTCANCGKVNVSDQTAPLGHKYEDVVIAPTCTEGGYTTHTCANCGETYTDAQTAALGHSYDEGVKNGNQITYTCTVCGFSYSVDVDVDSIQVPGNLTGIVNGTKDFTWIADQEGYLHIENVANLTGAYIEVTINGEAAHPEANGYAVKIGDVVVITVTTYSEIEINIPVSIAGNAGGDQPGDGELSFDVTFDGFNIYQGTWTAPQSGKVTFTIASTNIPAGSLVFRIIDAQDNWYNQYEFELDENGNQYITLEVNAGDVLQIIAYEDSYSTAGQAHIVVTYEGGNVPDFGDEIVLVIALMMAAMTGLVVLTLKKKEF